MSEPAVYEFGDYRLDPAARVLSAGDQPVALAPKTFDLLLLLVERPGRVLERDELIRRLWPDTVVEEANLTFQVSTLRKALGEDGPRWIETVPKHGYRFTAPVREVRAARASVEATRLPKAAARPPWPLIGGVVILAVAGALAFSRARRAPIEPPAALQKAVATPLTTYPGAEVYPTLSPDGSQLAFSWRGASGDNLDIYLKLVGPGEPHRLTTDPAPDYSAAWSPDGRQIAFLRPDQEDDESQGIYLMPALGGAERKLAEIELTNFQAPGGLLAWTPDGKWLAAAGRFGPTDPSEIWLFSIETGERRQLSVARDFQIGDVGLSFSPDGRHLALLRFMTRSVGDVYLLPLRPGYAAAGPPVRVTHEKLSVGGPCWNSRGDRLFYSVGGALGYRTLRMLAIDSARPDRPVQPVPFPAGEHATMLAFARDRLVYAREYRDSNIWRLEVPASGSSAPPTPLIDSTFDDHNPDFSADGTKITFTSTRSGTEEIWIANADGSGATQMTSIGGPNTSNSRWSRDGRTILFNSRRSGSSDLYLLDVASRALTRLTDDPSDDYEPRWSRDGKRIYFVSTRSGRAEVWKMPAGGGAAVQVTREGGQAAFESADGRWLYYAKKYGPTSIWRVPVDGGPETEVLLGLSYGFNFAVTEKGIYLMALRGTPPVPAIEFFDFATRTTKTLHKLDKRFWFGFALAPDERSILFSKIDSQGSDLMLVENVR